jgi:hypothetical protein
MKVVYKITYPNGKICIGQDVTDRINYFGSANSRLLAKDSPEQRREITARKQILWESETAAPDEVNQKEREPILAYRARDSAIGYNRWPRHRAKPEKDAG